MSVIAPKKTLVVPTQPASDPNVHGAEPETVDRPWSRAFQAGCGYWVVSHVMFLLIQAISWRLTSATGMPTLTEILRSWASYDARAYVRIAEQGYPPVTDPTFLHDDLSVYSAWPPGYPLVIRALSYLLPGVSFVAVAVLVANLAGLGLFVMLHRLVDHETGARQADRTLLYLVAFPTAFFFAMAYSESLFLLLAVSVLYLARRGHWWAAGGLGIAVSATKMVGLLIVVALAFEYMRQRDFKFRRVRLDVLSIGMVPIGIGIYSLYCWKRFGDPLIFSHVQIFWQRDGLAPPWESVYWSLQFGADRAAAFRNLLDVGSVVAVAALLVLALVGPWRLRRDQFYLWLFGAVPLALAVLQPVYPKVMPFAGMNRYALMALPAFMVLANIARSRFAEYCYLALALPVQAALMILFIRFEWAG